RRDDWGAVQRGERRRLAVFWHRVRQRTHRDLAESQLRAEIEKSAQHPTIQVQVAVLEMLLNAHPGADAVALSNGDLDAGAQSCLGRVGGTGTLTHVDILKGGCQQRVAAIL